MSLKIKLAKKIDGVFQVINPSTDADIVIYDENLSVKDALDALIETVDDMESKLFLDTIYMHKDGQIITDSAGTGAVAVASLAAAVIVPDDGDTGSSSP